jgi:hypothetical protein
MKKLLLYAAFCLCTLAVSAQQVQVTQMKTPILYPGKNIHGGNVMNQVTTQFPSQIEATGGTPVSAWYNTAKSIGNTGISTTNYFAPYLFFDTTAVYGIQDTITKKYDSVVHVQWTAVGQSFDPTEDVFNDITDNNVSLDSFYKSYTVDSLAIPYLYGRVVDSFNGKLVVDTLIVQTTTNPEVLTYTNQTTLRKESFGNVGYNISTNLAVKSSFMPASAVINTIKIPLTIADTTGLQNFGVKYIPLTNKLVIKDATSTGHWQDVYFHHNSTYPVVATYSYKSGVPFAFEAKDTVGNYIPMPKKRHNFFRMRMAYSLDDPGFKGATNGLVVQGQQRHNPNWVSKINGGNVPPRFIPGNFFKSFLLPDIYFHVMASQTTTGVGNNNQSASAISVYPNPASDKLNIALTLNNNSNVRINISNMLGQEIATVTNSKLMGGQYNLAFNTSSLNNGMYMCTITTGNETHVEHFVVSR